jgi:16S rRNA (uracil1498-N3)-methyltransferase
VLKRRPITRSMKEREQQSIAVGVLEGPIGRALLRAVDEGSITLECEWPPPTLYEKDQLLPLDVLVGLARPQTCHRILRDLSTIGVRSIGFVLCALSEPSYATSKLWRDGRWEQYLEHGAEQAFRTSLPAVRHYDSVQDALRCLPPTTTQARLVCHDDCSVAVPSLYSLDLAAADTTGISLMCGPERGLTDGELELLRHDGFTAVHLGPPIYRAELAASLASSVVAGRCGWMETGFAQVREARRFQSHFKTTCEIGMAHARHPVR